MTNRFMSPGQARAAQDAAAAGQHTWVTADFLGEIYLQDFLRKHAVTPDQIFYLTGNSAEGFSGVFYVPTATARRMEGGQE